MLKVKIEDDIIITSLHNGKTNSISGAMLSELEQIIDRLNSEETLKGLILTGTGRFFSSGFYLPDFYSFKNIYEAIDWFKNEEEILYKLFTCSKPVVAALNGHAVAGGLIYALASDYIVSLNHPKIKIGMSEIKIGLSLPPAQTEVMRWGLGTLKNYKDLIFSAENLDPAQAMELAIIDELVDQPEMLLEKAKKKVFALIDTPGRPFILLKYRHRLPQAKMMRRFIDDCDWQTFAAPFVNEGVLDTLRAIQASME